MPINYKKLSEIKTISSIHKVQLVAVTKNRSTDDIIELIKSDVSLFGENRVQEAGKKFESIKKHYKNISLQLIGPLQSNKTIDALKIFDCIQTIDREKIAKIISHHIEKDWCQTKNFFIQINIGKEKQKSGIDPKYAKEFYYHCLSLGLKIIGFMCIPPISDNHHIYFKEMKRIKDSISNNLLLSMGMSGDYLHAIENGSNMIRVGSAFFE